MPFEMQDVYMKFMYSLERVVRMKEESSLGSEHRNGQFYEHLFCSEVDG